MSGVAPSDLADDAVVEALLHRFADPRDLGAEVQAALRRTEQPTRTVRRRVVHSGLACAAAIVTLALLLLVRGSPEAERWLDRAIAQAGVPRDREYRIGFLQKPIEARLLLRGAERMLLEVRGPIEAWTFRTGVSPTSAWSISAAGRVEQGALSEFGPSHPAAGFVDLVGKSLRALRASPDLEVVPVPGRSDRIAMRSAREGLQLVLDTESLEVERLEVPWLVGRLDVVRRATADKQDLVYEHTSYHAPGAPVHPPSGGFALNSLFGLGGTGTRVR